MKAVYFDQFGTSDVLNFGELPTPTPGPGEVRIRLSHTSVNPVDWKIREGYLQALMPHELPIIPGWDASGTIEALGDGVSEFQVGDAVFAYARTTRVKNGTYAEQIVLPVTSVAPRPTSIDAASAASIPLTALTAWQGIKNYLAISAGATVLVTAGAGGVGSFAVQFLKAAGARVLTSASRRNHEYLRNLGADVVIDYTETDVAAAVRQLHPEGIDAVFDAAGGQALADAFTVLKKGGRLVSIVDSPDTGLAARYGVTAAFHFVEPSGQQLRAIADLIDSGDVKLPEILVRPIQEVAAVLDASKAGHTRGKVVMSLDFV